MGPFWDSLRQLPPPPLLPPSFSPSRPNQIHCFRFQILMKSGRGAARAEDAQGTPTQSHISPNILAYEENISGTVLLARCCHPCVPSLLLSSLELSGTQSLWALNTSVRLRGTTCGRRSETGCIFFCKKEKARNGCCKRCFGRISEQERTNPFAERDCLRQALWLEENNIQVIEGANPPAYFFFFFITLKPRVE